jgi:hypothetical protein
METWRLGAVRKGDGETGRFGDWETKCGTGFAVV